jgi:hypothetical protein
VVRQEDPATASEGLATLIAADDVGATFDFQSGTHGARVVAGELALDDCQIAWHVFAENQVSYGFVRDRGALMVPLGDLRVNPARAPTDHAPKLPVSVFHTLRVDDGRLVYDAPFGKVSRLREGERILSASPVEAVGHFTPEIGHVYLFAFKARSSRERHDMLVKMQVVDVQPGRTLTFRWARMR